jgi:hypothetical protein
MKSYLTRAVNAKQRFSIAAVVALLSAGVWAAHATCTELGDTSVDREGRPLAATRCAVQRHADGWWFVAPDGKRFFSLGVCMFNQGWEGKDFDPYKPAYAALRHYPTLDAWAEASLARLKSWGFTTVGGWSDYDVVRRAGRDRWWLTPVLHIGSTAGAPWFDMWDEKVVRRIEEVAQQNVGTLGGDPKVLGYYSDNELGWWNAVLWKMTLQQPSSSGQRQRLIQLVRETYRGNWNAMNRDFEPQDAANWDELNSRGMLWLRPGSNGIRAVRRFLALVADRYYQLMRDTIRKFDKEALFFGDRYQSFYYPEVAAASGPYVDVVSTNLNASWNDGTFHRSYVRTLHELSGKPVVISEVYMSAAENRSGNKNSAGGFPIVATQTERARATANSLRSLARLPYVVGADWFQYYDEPPHGRKLDGEDCNFGLVDIHDQPYAELTEAFSTLDLTALRANLNDQRTDATRGVPPAPPDPFGDFRHMYAIKHWDRERGFVPAASTQPTGDLYVCWKPAALYLAVFVIDIVEPDYYRDAEVPEVNRAMWSIRVNGGKAVTARVGSGKPPVVSDSSLRFQSLGGTYDAIRSITAVELPASRLGKQSFKPGDRVSLDSNFTTHARAHRIEWKTELTLAE